MENRELFKLVQETVADVLEVEAGQISEKTKPVVDLDAESLDLLDILFKLSKSTGKKVTMQVIQKDVRGGLSEEEFIDEEGYITAAGVNKIKQAVGISEIEDERLTSKDVLKLIDIKYMMKLFMEIPTEDHS